MSFQVRELLFPPLPPFCFCCLTAVACNLRPCVSRVAPLVTGIDEVNLFKDDDTVIHFSNPKVQMSNGTNTFVVSGNAGWPLPLSIFFSIFSLRV